MAGRFWGGRRAVDRCAAILLLLSISVTVLAACGSSEPEASSNLPSAQAVVAAFNGSPGNGGGIAGTGGETQTSDGGSVSIEVNWENAGNAAGSLSFAVAMDTHSKDLDGYDLGQLAVLRNDRGQEVNPELWDAPPGGHHRSGTLAFPASDPSGKPIVGPGVKAVELLIRDVAGVEERVLRWEVS